MMRLRILILAFSFSFFNAASQTILLSISNDVDSATGSVPWINHSNPKKGDAFKGNFYSVADSVNPYGLGYKGSFPEVCRNKNLRISINEFVRIKNPIKEMEMEMIVSVSFGDSLVVYNSRDIRVQVNKLNTWTNIRDSIDLPATLTGDGYTLAIYLWNKDGNSPVEMDALKIDFEEKLMPSFLPPMLIEDNNNLIMQKMFADKYYSFLYNKERGKLIILGNAGDTIVHSFSLYSEWIQEGKNERKNSWNNYLFLRKDSVTEEGTYIKLTSHDEISQSEILILSGEKGSLTFNVSTIFTSSVNLVRQAIVTGFSMPFTQVFKKNTLTDSDNLEKEYWLDKEGFIVSNGKNALALYHPEKVSSIQLDVVNRSAFFNLDYSADHPLLHFPILKESQNKFIDRSTSIYKKGDQINALFTF